MRRVYVLDVARRPVTRAWKRPPRAPNPARIKAAARVRADSALSRKCVASPPVRAAFITSHALERPERRHGSRGPGSPARGRSSKDTPGRAPYARDSSADTTNAQPRAISPRCISRHVPPVHSSSARGRLFTLARGPRLTSRQHHSTRIRETPAPYPRAYQYRRGIALPRIT